MSEKYNDRVCNSDNPTRFIKQRVSNVAPTLDADDDSAPGKIGKLKPALLTSAVAGGIAGVVVDISLYPLDTIKTRLQSPNGFRASGGFRGIYKGVVPVLLCSAPISSLFFVVYNSTINNLRSENQYLNPIVYLTSAAVAEIVSSTLRVPLEIVKQRKQISSSKSIYIIRQTLQNEGIPGFYRGFWSTLWRELPFAAIQYPLWEIMIHQFIIYQKGEELTALQTACCGAIAGGIAGILTTPMDVVKTRIMLAEKSKIDQIKKHINFQIAGEVYKERGIKGLFAGVVPRFLWITLGGFIYFGTYEKSKLIFEEKCKYFSEGFQKVRQIAPSYLEGKLENIIFSKEGRCELEFKNQSNSKEENMSRAFSRKEDHDMLLTRPEEISKEDQDIIDEDLRKPEERISKKKQGPVDDSLLQPEDDSDPTE